MQKPRLTEIAETAVPRQTGARGRRPWAGIALALALGAAAIIVARLMGSSLESSRTQVEFVLQDTDGKVVSDRTLRGRPYAILFGFTRCPDVCPTTLTKIARARAANAGTAALPVMFVGIDTQHDNPVVLDRYLSELTPGATGLTGTAKQIERAARAFDVYFRRVPVAKDFAYDHAATVFLVDGNGRVTDTIGTTDPQDVLAGKLRRLSRS